MKNAKSKAKTVTKTRTWPISVLPSGSQLVGGRLTVKYGIRQVASPTRYLAMTTLTPKTWQIKAMTGPLGNNSAPSQGTAFIDPGMDAPKTGMSDCAAGYMGALTSPFKVPSELPCLPMLPAVMTQKWRTLQRGVFGTGTGGYGYVMIAPTVGVNNVNKYFFTDGAVYAGTAATLFGAGAGITVANNVTLPYTAAELAAGIYARLVGLGLRVRNISQALAVGGILYVAAIPDGATLATYNATTIQARQDTVIIPQALQKGSDWTVLVWRPAQDSVLGFQPDPDYPAPTSTMVIGAIGPSASVPQLFEFEVVEYWEFMGGTPAKIVPDLTLTEADMVGVERVLNAAQRVPLTCEQNDWNAQMAHGVIDDIAHSDTVARTVEALSPPHGGLLGKLIPMAEEIMAFLAV